MSEHDDNDDGVEVRNLEPEDVQEVIDWAVSAGAMITLMHNAPEHDNEEEALERLEGYIQAIEIMINNMPDVLVEPAHLVAAAAILEAENEQTVVDEFLEQIKDL